MTKLLYRKYEKKKRKILLASRPFIFTGSTLVDSSSRKDGEGYERSTLKEDSNQEGENALGLVESAAYS